MGTVYLGLLYLATALALALLVRRSSGSGRGPSWRGGLLLTLLPLVFTAGGFLPGRALAPTNLLARVPPWLDPELTGRIAAESSRPNPLLFDPLTQMIPWQRAARENLLINPSQGGGAALLANGQSAVLFPTEIAGRLLSPLRGTTYTQAARLLVAVFGLYLLARSLALSELSALVGAAVWAGCGFLQLWRLHPHSLVAATAPWILWSALWLARRPGPRPAAALGIAGAAGALAGHPETLLHAVLLAGLAAALVLARRLRAAGRGERLGLAARALGAVSVSAALAFLLAAPLLLPLVENLPVSAEWQRRAGEVPDHLEVPLGESLQRLAFNLTPFAFGDPLDSPDGTPAGPENVVELGGGALGAAALLLIALALAAPSSALRPKGARRRSVDSASLGAHGPAGRGEADRCGTVVPGEARCPSTEPPHRAQEHPPPAPPDPPGPLAWLVLGLLALLVAAHVPWVSKPLGWVWLLEVSLVKRLTLWWALTGSLLAALGVERLLRRGGGRRALPVGAALIAALLGVVALTLPGARAAAGVPLELGALAAALAGVWWLGAPGGGPRPARGRWAALALLAGALVLPRGALFHRWVPLVSSYSFYPDTLAVREVAERLRGAPPGARVAGLDAALLPHAAAFLGFEEARAYDPMTFAPYERFLETVAGLRRPQGVRLLDPARPGLAFLGVRWIFDHPSMTHRPGVEVVYLGPDAIVYQSPRALPRLFVPAEVEVVEGEEAAFRAVAEIDDFARRAVLEWRPGLPEPGLVPNAGAEVTELEVAAGRVVAVVETRGVALVVTSQPAIPGWRLWRDGEEHEPLRVNGAFLGAAVEPGESRLVFLYDPVTWKLGLGLWVAGALLAVAMMSGRWRPGG